MSLKNLAAGIQALDPEKDPRGYLEHYVKQNWIAGSSQMSIAQLANANFDEKFVRDLFKKETPPEAEEDKIPDPSDEEIAAMQEKLAKERKSKVSKEDAKLHIIFERISEKQDIAGLINSGSPEPIFRWQDKLPRIFYHPDKHGQEKDPAFSMTILKNITSATQKMVEAALEEDFLVSLNIEAEHYDHVPAGGHRIGASPIYVGDKYEAKGNLYISV